MNTLFNLHDINAAYGEKQVLNNITLTIKQGDFTAFIGPNGAGKTTLLRLLTLEHTVSRGKILFKNKPLALYTRRQLAREFSIVHQFYTNLLAFRVYQFIRMGRFPYQMIWEVESSEDSAIIEEALAITGIEHLRDRSLLELSGGERQLVYIAHSYCQNRNIIILDEPIAHLDVCHAIRVMDLLYRLNREGATIISVLHNINMAADYCSSIYGIKEGRIVLSGTPDKCITANKMNKLFDTACIVEINQITGKPCVFPVPGYANK